LYGFGPPWQGHNKVIRRAFAAIYAPRNKEGRAIQSSVHSNGVLHVCIAHGCVCFRKMLGPCGPYSFSRAWTCRVHDAHLSFDKEKHLSKMHLEHKVLCFQGLLLAFLVHSSRIVGLVEPKSTMLALAEASVDLENSVTPLVSRVTPSDASSVACGATQKSRFS